MIEKMFVVDCYAMLHSGHVAFFQEAAKLRDLYVGLASDSTIWKLKGRTTINNNGAVVFDVKGILPLEMIDERF